MEAPKRIITPHFDGKHFFNPGAAKAKGITEVLRWKLSSRGTPWPKWIDDVAPLNPQVLARSGEVRVTLVNHSTLLLQIDGTNVLTDPIWSLRASPVGFAGPRRHRAPGVLFDDLPPIHAVLLSHNHYDHLDLPTLRLLHETHDPHFVVPLGVAALLRSQGIAARELDWWETADVAGIAVQSLPAQHFSARTLFDRNETLWCGYGLRTDAGWVYFAGDTGMGDHFAQIRKACGPPRLAMLPIGAYLPQWFMSPIHMSPAEAVEAHRLLESAVSVAIHHGTFQLADEGPDDAERDLKLLNIPEFQVLRNGDSVTLQSG